MPNKRAKQILTIQNTDNNSEKDNRRKSKIEEKTKPKNILSEKELEEA